MVFTSKWFRRYHLLFEIPLIATAYVVTGKIGLEFSYIQGNVTLVWPPTGIALAALLILGTRVWPGVALGAFLVNLWVGAPLPAAFIIMIGNTLQALTAAYALRPSTGFSVELNRLRDIMRFLMFGVVLSTMISATVGAAALLAANSTDVSRLPAIWAVWWSGDAIGILIVTPVLLAWTQSRTWFKYQKRRIEATALIALLVVVSVVVFNTSLATSGLYPLAYLTFPFLVWAAFRFGQREVVTCSLLISIVAVWGTSRNTGPFVRQDIHESLVFLWSYLTTVTITAMVIAAALHERRQAEQSLAKGEERFRSIYRNTLAMMHSIDADGRLIAVSQHWLNVLGYTEDEVLGRRSTDFLTPDSRKLALEVVLPAFFKTGYCTDIAYQYVKKDGEIIDVLLSAISERDADGNIIQSHAVLQDVTTRNRAEKELQKSKDRFSTAFNASPVGFTITRLEDSCIVDVNDAYLNMIGYQRHEVVGQRSTDMWAWVNPGDAHEVTALFQETGRVRQREGRFRLPDGTTLDLLYSLEMIELDGEAHVLSLILDNTERKRSQEALEKSEARFRATFEGVGIGIALVDEAGHTIDANQALLNMLGYSREELRQMTFRDFTAGDDTANMEKYRQFVSGEIDHYSLEKAYRHKDGHTVWGRINVSPFPGTVSDENLHITTMEDISERLKAEEALRQSEERFRAIFEGVNIGISVTDRAGRPLMVNQFLCEMLGYSPAELRAMTFTEFTHPDDQQSNLDLFQRFLRGEIGAYTFEKRYIHKDRHTVWARINASAFPFSVGSEHMMITAIQDISQRKQFEDALHQLNTELENRVTERTAELSAANERLTELDQLKSKFIADVSHELRTPLAVLNTRVYLLERSSPEKRDAYIEGLRQQIEQLTTFVNTVLDLSRLDLGKGKIEFEEVDFCHVLRQVVSALAPRAETAGLSLHVEYAVDETPVYGEANQLSQVATNLIANAINYTREGSISITLDIVTNRMCLQVSDTGMGISSADMPHLFERFYRGERAGQSTVAGTGLGLSIVKEILDLHGGDIEVESSEGRGSTFRVWLPVYRNRGEQAVTVTPDTV